VTIPNASILSDRVFNSNSGVPDCQVVTDVYLPCGLPPREVQRVGYEAAYTCPFLYSAKPVVVLLISGFDRGPYLKLRVKAYVFDHRFEPRMMSDITERIQEEMGARGMLADWPGLALERNE
jgi:small-conductance mechanosensitive channel